MVSTFTVQKVRFYGVGRERGSSLFSGCGVLDDEKFWKYVVARMSLWMHSGYWLLNLACCAFQSKDLSQGHVSSS